MSFSYRQSYYAKILLLFVIFLPNTYTVGILDDLSDLFDDLSERTKDFVCSYISCCGIYLERTTWSRSYKDTLLYDSLQLRLFGQHLVHDAVARGITLQKTKPGRSALYLDIKRELDNRLLMERRSQWKSSDGPYKNVNERHKLINKEYKERLRMLGGGALVIFMYGPPGSGKSYASKIIAESLYKKGLNSPLVHRFGGKAFISLESNQYAYGLNLLDWIQGNITYCPHSMFIFDEFNEFPMQLIESVMKTTINTETRHAVFVFVMTTEGMDAIEKMLALYEEGKIREEIKLEDVYQPGFGELFTYLKKKHGLDKPLDEEKFIIGKPNNLIFAPFLPLESKHVKECIIDCYGDKGLYPSDDEIMSIQEMVKYKPEGKEKFPLFGCKYIQSLVTSALSRRRNSWKKNDEL